MSPAHQQHWPDKAMFASIMLILAGTMGLLFELLRMSVAFSPGEKLPTWLVEYPPMLSVPLAAATVALGFVGLRSRRKRYAFAGCAAGLASLAFLGLVPLLSLFAVAFLVLALREGEFEVGRRKPIAATDWPDKALAASLFLFVAGILAAMQGALMAFGLTNAYVLKDLPWLEGGFDIAAAIGCLWAAWETYHVRRPWAGFTGVALACLSLGFVVLGPLLAVTALVLLVKANREDEFLQAETA